MDCFAIVVGFAGISPDYFYNRLTISEFVAIGQAYREDWEKARLPVLALGGTLAFPWDGKGLTAHGIDRPPIMTSKQRVSIGKQLADYHNKKHLEN